MPLERLEPRMRRQFASLVKLFPGESEAMAFLAEDMHPLDRASVLRSARVVALDLLLAKSEDEAKVELLKDRAKTQAFYSTVIAAFPVLQDTLNEMPGWAQKEKTPFYELCSWILEISGPE